LQSPWSRSRRRSPAPEPAGSEEERLDRIACSQCGAELTYAPGTRAVRCAYCGHEQAITGSPWQVVVERDLAAALERAAEEHIGEERRVLKCETCAASFDAAERQGAGRCPFCGSAIVADPARTRRIRPDGVVPFAIPKETAQDALRQWLAGLWFAPSDLSRRAEAEARMEGLYLPFWTYDCATETEYRGARGIRVVRHVPVRRAVDGKAVTQMQAVTELRWTPVAGRVARRFDDVLVPAARALPLDDLGRAGAWNMQALRAYAPDWLAGFRSALYDIPLADGFAEAQAAMRAAIDADIRRDIGGDAQRVTASRTAWRDATFKHVLLPVWVAAYRYRGRTFRFVVNGQTGQAHGERPWSVAKIALAVLAALAVAGALALIAGEAG
jgi:LSD1 subclass zinc finger protein